LAPWVAALRAKRRSPSLTEVVAHIRSVCAKIERSALLLIEGAGGLLVPLGADFTMLDIIVALQCETILVAGNKLGTINHTLLSILALKSAWQDRMPLPPRAAMSGGITPTLSLSPSSRVVLMNARNPDSSAASNPSALARLLGPTPLISVPFLGRFASSLSAVRRNEKKIKKTLARILD
ncbi:MAG: ATP-dependent dethiobiotin synthetase BioD, partial [Limisphaerales bacterium]